MRSVLQGNYVFVTNNRDDFHDLVDWAEIHPGLVVLLGHTDLPGRQTQFAAALTGWTDAINKGTAARLFASLFPAQRSQSH